MPALLERSVRLTYCITGGAPRSRPVHLCRSMRSRAHPGALAAPNGTVSGGVTGPWGTGCAGHGIAGGSNAARAVPAPHRRIRVGGTGPWTGDLSGPDG